MIDPDEIIDLGETEDWTDEDSPDYTIEGADWTKKSFDFPGIDSAEKLRRFIEASGDTVEHFKTLPVYKLNVDKIPWLREL